jgi:hypothetical protein
MAKGRFNSYLRFLRQLPGFLHSPIDVNYSRDRIAHRLGRRNQNFLSLVQRCVYEHPASPYHALLKEAGCEYGDVAAGVRNEGIEATLRNLLAAGVWISLDEFKGRAPIQRGRVTFYPEPGAFDNPYHAAGLGVSTGGTSGRSRRTRFDLEFMAERACYDSLMADMLGITQAPLALWYPILPASTGIGNTLRYAKAGFSPARWFAMDQSKVHPGSLKSLLATHAIIWISRFTGAPLPRPEFLALSRHDRIADWVINSLDQSGICVVQTYVSQAVRICQAVRSRRSDLSGLTLIVGSEPMTRAKHREIASTGARAYLRYAATEMGTIAMGCGNPQDIDELHLVSDMIAMIQSNEVSPGQTAPFFFSTLNNVMPKVMINVQLGDMGVAHERECGCVFETIGFHTHISHVRSYERVTGEGMAVSGRILEQIVDEIILPRYGGSSLDYQWVESEDENGLTHVILRVAPSLGDIDESSLIRDVLDHLGHRGEGEKIMAEIWHQAGAVSIVRESPQTTERGKTLFLQRHTHAHRA